MATLSEALSLREADLFVGRERELALFRQWLEAEPSDPVILNVSGPGGVGKSTLLRAFRRIALARGRPVVLADSATFPATPAGLLHALGGSEVEEVPATLNATRPLLLLDGCAEPGSLTRWLQKELLARLETNVKVVIAGSARLELLWRQEEGWLTLIHPLPLTGLAPAECRAYLARRGLHAPTLVEQIVQATAGHPLALALAADLALQVRAHDFAAVPEWHLVTRSLVEWLLRDLPDPGLRALLEACAVVRHFDEATLAAVTGQDDVGEAFAQLCQLSVVRPTEHGLLLHKCLRHILADDLRWRQPERYTALRQRALAYYRERMRRAPATEREWLLADRFALWEHEFLQAVFGGADESDQVWVEPGRPEDHAEVLRLAALWQEHILPTLAPVAWPEDFTKGASLALTRALLRYAGLRLRLARGPDGQAIGYSMVVPVCRESVALLRDSPHLGAVLRRYFRPADLATLPPTAQTTHIFYLMDIVYSDESREAVAAALLRDMFGVLALGGLYFAAIALPRHRDIIEALGFAPVAGASSASCFVGHPLQGYVLDLRRLGVDAWMDALMSGRQPLAALTEEERESAVRAALLHWHDDAALAQSPLAPRGSTEEPALSAAEAVRQAIRAALAAARTAAPPGRELAYRALELAYLGPRLSHARAAERLAVSRATFYRLLERGVHDLARALTEPAS
jgi:AAA ATPase domain